MAKVAKALVLALNNDGLNVVCNQEYAQAVPHVHYHLIPAPILGGSAKVVSSGVPPLSGRQMARLEFEARSELDEEEGEELSKIIRAKL